MQQKIVITFLDVVELIFLSLSQIDDEEPNDQSESRVTITPHLA